MTATRFINVVDSHTGGEPTRIIIDGGPDLGTGPLSERATHFKQKFDHIRSAVVNEPRGSDVLVGGLLCEPYDKACSTGVIFFNNVGLLGMCGHGTIGLITTLKHIGRLSYGTHFVDTPVGPVKAVLNEDDSVTVTNVESYRHIADVTVDVPDYGRVTGDVAWGGNWFFLVKSGPAEELTFSNSRHLSNVTLLIRDALARNGITGANGAEVDHVELFSPPRDPRNNSRNFVMCPGGAFDRSPCGTGTSAKLACLAEEGKLAPGENWNQESILGSVFSCAYVNRENSRILPTITGRAYINGEARLILNEKDPFFAGIRDDR